MKRKLQEKLEESIFDNISQFVKESSVEKIEVATETYVDEFVKTGEFKKMVQELVEDIFQENDEFYNKITDRLSTIVYDVIKEKFNIKVEREE